MIELKQYCRVPYPEKLFEQYEVDERCIRANVGASKVIDMMKRFVSMREEPMFFVLEIPAKKEDEERLGGGKIQGLHTDVYYIDGLDSVGAINLLKSIGSFLVKDGLNGFGFGGHDSHEEIFFGKYNVMTIFCADKQKYESLMAEFGIEKTNELVTAWDTFDKDHGGECELYVNADGKTIYDLVEAYEPYGLYFAERRGDTSEAVSFEELLGKVILAGYTYYTAEGEFIERKQLWGTVTESNSEIIRVKRQNGEEFTMPPDLRSVVRAAPGDYTLRSTGETVTNPDFTVTWNVTRPKE